MFDRGIATALIVSSLPACSGAQFVLIDAPERDDVIPAMRAIAPGIAACAPGQGDVMLGIRFGSSGAVTAVNVPPPFAGTAAGECMARAARTARMPRFRRPSFTVNYPFRLR